MTIMNKSNLHKLHTVLLDMYKDMENISESLNINIFMGGGTMLGAIRHGGFIPWDDDLDLMIFRKDVKTFLNQFEESKKYHVQFIDRTEEYPYAFIKIRKKGTILKEKYTSEYPISSEIFIDIFIMENIPNSKLKRKIHGYQCDIISRLSHITYHEKYSSQQINAKLSIKDKLRSLVARLIGFLIDPVKLVKLSEKINSKYAHMETVDITIPTGRKKYFGEIYPKEFFENYIFVRFGDMNAKSTPFFKEYLGNLYGSDFMVVPEPSDRESHDIIEFKV